METQTNNQELKDILLSMGAPAEKVDEMINEVNGIAIARALNKSIEKWPEDLKEKVKLMEDPQSLAAFMKENEGKFPKVTEEELIAAVEETWREYAEALEEKQ